MMKRTTIEIDEELLAQAQRALETPTMRATVEEALRRTIAGADDQFAERRRRQLAYFERLSTHADLTVLESDDMWR